MIGEQFDPAFMGYNPDQVTKYLANSESINSEHKYALTPKEVFQIGVVYEAGYRQASLENMRHYNHELRDKLEVAEKQAAELPIVKDRRDYWYDRALTAERKLDNIKKRNQKKKTKGKK